MTEPTKADETEPARRRWWQGLPTPNLGLRARITLAFALGAALLSTLLAGTTWALTRENILNQRESSATRQAVRNSEVVEAQMSDPVETDLRVTLSSLNGGPSPSQSLVIDAEGVATKQSPSLDASAVPDAQLNLANDGVSSRMRTSVDGTPQLVIAVPLLEVDGLYIEFVSLEDTESTLQSLSTSLFGATLVTTLAGAGLGLWASRRTLRPLAEVSVAAEAIAGGRLDTRLTALDDPDLGVLVTSFNHMATVLEERIEQDVRFASDVSHELRSPLMTLSASIEVLGSRRDDMPDASAQAAVDLMVADVDRFKQLVEDLLEISRFDAGAARLELGNIAPGELTSQAVAWSQTPHVPVNIDPKLAGHHIRADKRRLVRIVTNLLDNARKYGGGATSVALIRTDQGIQFAVEDSGPGVPMAERDLIFDRFSRGAGSNRRAGSEGVGLGLSLVAEHVALHKGQVWVEDRPDGEPGARFVVELPMAWDEEPDDAELEEDVP